MSLKNKVAGAAAALAVAAMNVTAFAGAAQAHDWNGRGPDSYRSERYDWRDRYAYERYREHKHDKKVARGLAIGLGVVLLGSILASEANHGHGYGY